MVPPPVTVVLAGVIVVIFPALEAVKTLALPFATVTVNVFGLAFFAKVRVDGADKEHCTGVGAGVGVGVGFCVGSGVGVAVGRGVGVEVGCGVGVDDGVDCGVGVASGEAPGVGVAVGSGVAPGLPYGVGEATPEGGSVFRVMSPIWPS